MPYTLGTSLFYKIGVISVQITNSATMAGEKFNEDLEMINAGCCSSDSPLNTQFLLSAFEEKNSAQDFMERMQTS